jgi:hypothetical protein
MNTDELRKLAEAADGGHWYDDAELYKEFRQIGILASNADADAAFIAAASPAAVLALLAERDEARTAVKRLAGALVNMLDDGDRMDKIAASEAMAAPVVKRIVGE